MVQDKNNMRKKTFSLPDKTAKELENLAQDKYQGMKGALSLIVNDALQDYFKKIRESQ